MIYVYIFAGVVFLTGVVFVFRYFVSKKKRQTLVDTVRDLAIKDAKNAIKQAELANQNAIKEAELTVLEYDNKIDEARKNNVSSSNFGEYIKSKNRGL